MNQTAILCTVIACGAYLVGICITTPYEIDKARYSALQKEYQHQLSLKNADIKYLELRIKELELLADKEWTK